MVDGGVNPNLMENPRTCDRRRFLSGNFRQYHSQETKQCEPLEGIRTMPHRQPTISLFDIPVLLLGIAIAAFLKALPG